jgi:hypothetical protein
MSAFALRASRWGDYFLVGILAAVVWAHAAAGEDDRRDSPRGRD